VAQYLKFIGYQKAIAVRSGTNALRKAGFVLCPFTTMVPKSRPVGIFPR